MTLHHVTSATRLHVVTSRRDFSGRRSRPVAAGVLLATDRSDFVPAVHVGAASTWNPLLPTLRVAFPLEAKSTLLDGVQQSASAPPPISRYARGWRLALAWVINLVALGAVCLGLMLIGSTSQAAAAQELQATGQSESTWWQAVMSAVLLAYVESYIVMDAIKVSLFTLTSSNMLDRALPPGSASRVALHKPLRRLHLALDAVA